MNATVTVLLEGYTNALSPAERGEEVTRPTVTLVRDGDLAVVVDPGILVSQQVLIDALAREGLTPNDIDVVCLTQSKVSHYRNVSMFGRAKIVEYYGLWDGEKAEAWPEQFSPHIQILRTPGHDHTGISMFVDTEDGVVGICGDVFWSENYPAEPYEDRFASDAKELAISRSIVLSKADWIIPGHGPMFKVKTSGMGGPPSSNGGNGKPKQIEKVVACKKCRRVIGENESCICRPWLCFRCCKCGLDCDRCSCSHKRMK